MAKVFLDTNYFIDIVEHRKQISWQNFTNHSIYLSPLSVHILAYLYKYSMPDYKLKDKLDEYVTFVPITELIVHDALLGPTADFEDNVQLHSAAQADCDLFLTGDKKLLEMKFFGKAKIGSEINI